MGLFGLRRTVTPYDLTNTSLESGAGRQPKARRGHSEDRRTERPPPALGLVLDVGGFVCRSQVFVGNVCEHRTPAEMLNAPDAPRGAPVVTDRGIATEERACAGCAGRDIGTSSSAANAPGTSTPKTPYASAPRRTGTCISKKTG